MTLSGARVARDDFFQIKFRLLVGGEEQEEVERKLMGGGLGATVAHILAFIVQRILQAKRLPDFTEDVLLEHGISVAQIKDNRRLLFGLKSPVGGGVDQIAALIIKHAAVLVDFRHDAIRIGGRVDRTRRGHVIGDTLRGGGRGGGGGLSGRQEQAG